MRAACDLVNAVTRQYAMHMPRCHLRRDRHDWDNHLKGGEPMDIGQQEIPAVPAGARIVVGASKL